MLSVLYISKRIRSDMEIDRGERKFHRSMGVSSNG